ncbi:MAG: hypothetical protein KDK12_14245 [Rhodobacteraceae bacterium]|nr:hypothetical protein [Paracoccaceae bacterium]
MLLNPEVFEDHLAQATPGGVREAFLAFAHAEYPGGLTARATSNGFKAQELRIERGETWYFSAVLHADWVLWYFRKPAFRDGLVDPEDVEDTFPAAHVTPKGEISLRVTDAATAAQVIATLSAPR